MSSQGTRVVETAGSSGGGTSGICFKKTRLIAPITALKVKSTEYCQGCVFPASVAAETRNVMKLATFWTAASRTRYLPRDSGGTRAVIHGSHAQLEIPRERLKQKSSTSSSA